MTSFGTQIAIVDDKPNEVIEIQRNLQKRNVGYTFYDATPDKRSYPDSPIETLDTIFLDLHYGERGVRDFDEYQPANWINKLVPENHKYFLVAWTLDTDDFVKVLNVLSQLNKTPYAFFAAQKNRYQQGDTYDIEKLFSDIERTQKDIKITNTVKGQIIAIEEDKVVVKCRVSEDKPIFQVRRFDMDLFKNGSLIPELNSFIKIQITTEPGIRTIEFFKTNEDMRGDFEVDDFFKDFNDPKLFGG
ncbi:hypothetical protein D2V93_17950 [Flagellimonas taeanensis]|uniref:hypothetical protein n=1 Tax=Flavobacteriaceae TaxID=49546 RepID=UPI000E6773CC|nr:MULTISPECIES: hypothetical protein [Allomuricauda]MDC6386276.1 hypothetical protein [Muricauda sp. SK9]RIV48048.1 hypothetical protein D2V93_17950 [Allomuricauda taeanensis]